MNAGNRISIFTKLEIWLVGKSTIENHNTLVCLKLGPVCVTNFGESPSFLDKASLVKTRTSQFLSKKSSTVVGETLTGFGIFLEILEMFTVR